MQQVHRRTVECTVQKRQRFAAVSQIIMFFLIFVKPVVFMTYRTVYIRSSYGVHVLLKHEHINCCIQQFTEEGSRNPKVL